MPLIFAKRAAPVVAAVLLLAACEEEAAPEVERSAEQGGRAAGDVLGGTISDDMLPLERPRSQSPPLEREAADGEAAPAAGDEAGGDAGAEGGEDAAAPAATGLPVASPAPQ
jgi:hypothetical protein